MLKEENNIYRLPEPKIVKDYYADYTSHRGTERTIVIDYGSSECRMGWAGEASPSLTFRNVFAKSRKDMEIQIGNGIGNIEAVRQVLRSPFDRNVITHLEALETLLDYGMSRLGVDSEGRINHPVCFTECLGNPNAARQMVNQLMFELYGIHSISYGIDGLFSLHVNQSQANDALVVSLGHQTITVMPVLDGKTDVQNARRINLGGHQLLSYMQKVLQLRYQNHANALTFSRLEEMFSLTRVSQDFFTELRRWKEPNFYERNVVKVQLPYVATVKPPPTDPEVLKARRQELGKRLMEINARKRETKLVENNRILAQLEAVLELHKQGSDIRLEKALLKLNLSGLEELQSLINKTRGAINKASEAKLREANREVNPEPEPKRRREDMDATERDEFDAWISDLRWKLQEIRERKAARAQRRKQLAKRRTAASQERMRIISQLARNNKEEDDFGMKDSDWDVYKKIARDAEDSDSEEESLKAQEYESVLKEHGAEEETNRNTPDWHQVHLSTELTLIPEIIFQPSIIGIDQTGLAETIQFIFSKYSEEVVRRLANNVFLTGGLSKISGLKTRLENELQQMLPFKSTFKVTMAEDPSLDGWRGASHWANQPDNNRFFLSREEYLERGCNGYFKQHLASNLYHEATIPAAQNSSSQPT